ncbi:arginine--tRNA ligase [Candidatus Kaiserbacteria bacterium CG10_big_fil_rev_8_21_14_0_10_59_10]|uniref:Arginine--tRNA ligase n=1 Tax=Candidatus Kaiserbacteria bacterium CG10_big_fil_rev_8_21_14_0_10_59_10 TaxID=1974612 RepID=A0A2H0U8H5_9BACT|nr:MAG: arginine--tRNA ligase [Candidatus Kaiserbacteria bacterium CG10_big_fil_rev_8_21_14_0_10_59_10]
MHAREHIKKALADALGTLGIARGDAILLEHPAELSHGDYATGAALQYAKQTGLAPRELAEKIVAALGTVEGVAKTEIAGPGFINFHLSSAALAETLQAARDEQWGRSKLYEGEHVLLEYTSPNLFKPLHVGNLVGNIVGESLARLFDFSAAQVTRINYPSDIGLTVAKGVWGIQKTGADPSDIHALGEAYRAGNQAYEEGGDAKKEIDDLNRRIYEGDAELNAVREAGVKTSLAHLNAICKQLGTSFDFELFESEAGKVGAEIVRNKIGEVFEESQGAVVFPGEKHGLHTRVFLNSAGWPTYEAKDIGNFKLKTGRYKSWTQYFVVTGAEQKEYFKVVIAAIRMLFPEAQQKIVAHVATGFLTPTTGKMSSRAGNVITGESILADLGEAAKERAKESRADDTDALAQQVAVAAIKYQILKQAAGKDIIFDRERALSLEGDSGPYLQYSHARTSAILEKAAEQGVTPKADAAAEPNDVARLVSRFPDIVERAAQMREPHIVTTYLVQLAGAFNSYYAQVHILDGSTSSPHKVALTDAVRQTLKNGLYLLGIPAPTLM